jgi:AcrR family transcriptional regulator
MEVATRKKAAAVEVNDDVRAQILAAAVTCMEEGGLADVSMREVARRAGVSHQLPYHYFTDREGILAAVAQAGFELLRERFVNAVSIEGNGADKLAAAGRAYVEFACDHPAHFRVMFRQDFVAMEKHADAQASADSCFAQLPLMIMEAIEEGLPPHPNPQALVVMGWSMAHGLACLLLDGPLAKKIPEAAGAREQTVSDVMEAMRSLLATSMKSK